MKKSLLSLLIFALIFTMAAPAFANTSEDLGEYGTAVDRLMSLGVLTGHGDGSFKANDSITRAEFAAVAVRLLGLEEAAKVSGGSSTFKDAIPAWAQGYVNVAAQQGIVTGHGDGTFKPSDTVTHAEALTMLVRALGYKPAVNQDASWPTNYLVVAAQIGLTKGVDVSAYQPATRGETSLFANSSLNVAKMIQLGFGTQAYYVVSGTQSTAKQTILADDLGATKTTEVVGAPALTDKGLVPFVSGNVAQGSKFVISNGNTLADLLGHEVEVLTVGGKVVFVNDAQAAGQVVTGQLDQALTVTSAVYVNDETIVADAAAVYYANGAKVTTGTVAAVDSDVTVFLDADNEARFVVANEWQVDGEVVSSVTAATTYKLASVTTNAGTFSVQAEAEVTLNGNAADITDLGENDVVYARTVADADGVSGTAANVVEAYSQVVTGKVTSKTTEGGEKVVVDGTTLEATASAYATITVGTEYNLFLDKNEVVIKAVAVTAATTDLTGVFVKEDNYTPVVDGKVKPTVYQAVILDLASGKEVSVDIEDNQNVSAVSTGVTAGDVVTLTLNSDGLVSAIAEDHNQLTVVGAVTVSDITGSKVTFSNNANQYLVTDSTVVVDVYSFDETAANADADDLAKITFSDVNEGDNVNYVLNADGLTVDYIFVNEADINATEAPTLNGVYVSSHATVDADNKTTTFVKVNVDGQVQTVVYEGALPANLVKGEAVSLTDADKNGKYAVSDTVSTGVETTFNSSKATGSFSVDAGANYFITTADTEYYVVTVDSLKANLNDITGATIYTGQFNDVKDLVAAGGSTTKIAVVAGDTLGSYTVAEVVVVYVKAN